MQILGLTQFPAGMVFNQFLLFPIGMFSDIEAWLKVRALEQDNVAQDFLPNRAAISKLCNFFATQLLQMETTTEPSPQDACEDFMS